MKFSLKKIIMILVIVGVFTTMFAEEKISSSFDVIKFYHDGGPFMHILTILLVVMLIFAFIKFFQLSVKEKFDAQKFYLRLRGYIKNEQYAEAVKICAGFKKKTMGFIFWNGLVSFKDAKDSGKKGEALKDALENGFGEATMQQIPKITANLFWFDIISQVATLIGLLGTIYGLILSFKALANAPEAERATRLAAGISVAMGTTGYGLIIAIPTMFIKGFFQNRSEKIVNEIDEYSVKTINQISYTIKD